MFCKVGEDRSQGGLGIGLSLAKGLVHNSGKRTAYDRRPEDCPARRKPQELLAEENGIELWANYALDRVQLVFPAKPGHEQRETLKRPGWKWSPTNEAWQRQLTNAAIHAGKQFLAGQKVEPERDSPGR